MTHPFTVSHDSRHLILVEQFVGHILQHGHDLWAGDGAVLPHTSTSLSGRTQQVNYGSTPRFTWGHKCWSQSTSSDDSSSHLKIYGFGIFGSMKNPLKLSIAQKFFIVEKGSLECSSQKEKYILYCSLKGYLGDQK